MKILTKSIHLLHYTMIRALLFDLSASWTWNDRKHATIHLRLFRQQCRDPTKRICDFGRVWSREPRCEFSYFQLKSSKLCYFGFNLKSFWQIHIFWRARLLKGWFQSLSTSEMHPRWSTHTIAPLNIQNYWISSLWARIKSSSIV